MTTIEKIWAMFAEEERMMVEMNHKIEEIESNQVAFLDLVRGFRR